MVTRTVLGLSLNSRIVSFAIMEGKTLVGYHTSLFKGTYNDAKRDHILKRLKRLLAPFTINEIVLVYPYEIHSSENIKHLLESVETYFKSQNIPISIYYPDALHLVHEEERNTKKALMDTMTELYPELEPHYRKELRNKSKYYVRMFEAVALAHIHSQSISQKS